MLRSFWSVVVLSLLWALPAHAQEDFLPVEQAFRLSVSQDADGQVRLNWKISEGYYLYRKQVKVEGDPSGSVKAVILPPGIVKTDEFFGASEVYHDQLAVQVNAPGAQALNVSWQGCAEAGICYPPQTLRVTLDDVAATPVAASGTSAGDAVSASSGALGADQALADRLSRVNPGWMLVVFFGLGLLMTFTPCVLPMLPILSSLIAGSGASPRRGFILSLAFVLPMALTYAGVGAAAALAGANLQATLQNPWVLGT
ncbi:MAG: thiol:disulfide interchange protein, partial [Hydrogenophilales bacterium 17-62-8]